MNNSNVFNLEMTTGREQLPGSFSTITLLVLAYPWKHN